MSSEHAPLISANVPFTPKMIEQHHWCRPLDDPQWRVAGESGHMRPEDPVLGVAMDGRAWALPWWVMKNHHVANLVLGGRPTLVTLCESCSSAAAFTAQVGARRLNFHLAGVLNGTHYIADVETGSHWQSFEGEAFAGPLQGTSLNQLPLLQCTWAQWLAWHPHTEVLFAPESARQGHGSGASPGSPEWDGFDLTLLHPLDRRLPHNTLVLGVKSGSAAKAYSLDSLAASAGVVNDRLGETDVVILHSPGSWAALAFGRRMGERSLAFRRIEDGTIVDDVTGSRWREDGVCQSGEMVGFTLPFVPSLVEEWYGWSAYHPETELFGVEVIPVQNNPSMAEEEISAVLVSHIKGELASAAEVALTPDYPLIESGLIDSLTLFRLVTFLQERFKIKIRPNEIVVENFANLSSIVQLVLNKQAAAADPS